SGRGDLVEAVLCGRDIFAGGSTGGMSGPSRQGVPGKKSALPVRIPDSGDAFRNVQRASRSGRGLLFAGSVCANFIEFITSLTSFRGGCEIQDVQGDPFHFNQHDAI
ncbi:MAG TPA: hypothetical protein PKH31_12970, partial [Candidatus Sumerlaeota bacterium]|nr:hypothetical protein [Candidatus Sumerlaeota bacterium]